MFFVTARAFPKCDEIERHKINRLARLISSISKENVLVRHNFLFYGDTTIQRRLLVERFMTSYQHHGNYFYAGISGCWYCLQ